MNRPTCETCPYFKADDGSYGDECRHSPPQWVWGGHDSDPGIQGWPETEARFWCGQHPDFPAWLEAQREPARTPCRVHKGFIEDCGCPAPEEPTPKPLSSATEEALVDALSRSAEEPTLTVAEVTMEWSRLGCEDRPAAGDIVCDKCYCTAVAGSRPGVAHTICSGTFRRVVPDPEPHGDHGTDKARYALMGYLQGHDPDPDQEPEAHGIKATRIDHPHSLEDSIILQYYGNDISLAQVAALVGFAGDALRLIKTEGAVSDRAPGVNKSKLFLLKRGLESALAPFKSEEGE